MYTDTMRGLFEEIQEIPDRAQDCLAMHQGLELPRNVPYIGMGSSYYAPLTLFYCGIDITPYIASEYHYYLTRGRKKNGVLLSQSGESSETIWNLDSFEHVTAITNKPHSPLGRAPNVDRLVDIAAGEENFSSTKSYLNTLVTLYVGLGINPTPAIEILRQKFDSMQQLAQTHAHKIIAYLDAQPVKGLYILGSGPNYGTALEAALTLGETTKLSWVGLPAAQYDHGPKEAADNSIVLILNAYGKDQKRIESIKKTLQTSSNALIIELNEDALPEPMSPVTLTAQLNWLMNYLADGLQVGPTFQLGKKVTTVTSNFK